MVTLVVATKVDLDSINPANELLAMSGWRPGPSLQEMKSFANREVRLLLHDRSIVVEDDLDNRWEELAGEVIFFSRHTAVSNRPAPHCSSDWKHDKNNKVLGIGGGHYAPRHMDIVL